MAKEHGALQRGVVTLDWIGGGTMSSSPGSSWIIILDLDHGEAVEAEDVPVLQLSVGERIVRPVRVQTRLFKLSLNCHCSDRTILIVIKKLDLCGHLEPNPSVHKLCLFARSVSNVGLKIVSPLKNCSFIGFMSFTKMHL